MSDFAHTFIITEKENEAIEQWRKEHIATVHNGNNYFGAIGGELTYQFTPTSIGVVGTVKCVCGESFEFASL